MTNYKTTSDPQATRGRAWKNMGVKERLWSWKAGLRVAVCVIDIIAVGSIASLIAGSTYFNRAGAYYVLSGFAYWGAGVLVALFVSFAWCLISLVVPFMLKPPRPLHPGIAVGIDLVLWLAFIVIGLFMLTAVFNILQFTDRVSYVHDPLYHANYRGEYYVAPNNTLIYNVTYAYPRYYNSTIDAFENATQDISSIVRSCTPQFSSCADQDAYINDVWRKAATRVAPIILANAIEWLNVVFHFTLFVWACVDTHRYNRNKLSAREQIIADTVIADLELKGLVTVRDGVVKKVVAQDAAVPR